MRAASSGLSIAGFCLARLSLAGLCGLPLLLNPLAVPGGAATQPALAPQPTGQALSPPLPAPQQPRPDGSAAPSAVPARWAPLPLPEPTGQGLLMRSRQRADYGPLSQEFLTQANLSYCGVASAVMVLNSLKIPAPGVPGYGSYRFWTQDNIFTGGTGGPEEARVKRRGMTLAQLRDLLAGRGVGAETIEASGIELGALRQRLRRSLADPEDRVLVNYDRRGVGQAGGGHISPLAAFDEGSDRVLILDVARYRYPAVWVPLALLWNAMRGVDPDSGRSRGLVLVRPLSATAPTMPTTTAPPPAGTAPPPGPN